jgi:hypothetical protein
MRRFQFSSFLLIAMAASAQHATGVRGGSVTGFRSGAGRFSPPTIATVPSRQARFSGGRFNRPFGNSAAPYSPYLWAYPFFGDYGLDYDLPSSEDRATNNTIIVQPSPPPISPAPPAQPAHAEIKEYKWNEPAGAGGDGATTFTIALKDGSMRYPVAVWVQDRDLHFVDTQGRQQVLSSDLIDRITTERLNRQNNLNLQLPPS